jgi:hypothetical protein
LTLDTMVAIKEYYPTGFVSRETTSTTTVQTFSGSQGEFFQQGKDKFINEAKSLAKFFSLPGIVSVRSYFQENGTAYIAMEFIDGQTMKEYLEKMGGKIPAAQVFDMMKPIMSSLARIHLTGLIHRDISPDNIMITKDGQMKLLDFGAARDFTSNGNRSMSIMLKPGFAPEEQYRSKGVQGPWTDIYAFSATMYRMITGITPEESVERVRMDGVKPPSALGIAIDSDKEAVLMQGMAVLQENRFKDMEQMSNAMFAGDASGGVPAMPTAASFATPTAAMPAPAPVTGTGYATQAGTGYATQAGTGYATQAGTAQPVKVNNKPIIFVLAGAGILGVFAIIFIAVALMWVFGGDDAVDVDVSFAPNDAAARNIGAQSEAMPDYVVNEMYVDTNNSNGSYNGRYTGEWRQGKPHGEGKIIYNAGNEFDMISLEGKWENGMPVSGTMSWKSGSSYTGTFLYVADKEQYTMLNGEGEFYFDDDDDDYGIISFIGEIKNGDIYNGVLETTDGTFKVVEGEIADLTPVSLESGGTLIVVGDNDDGQCNLSGWNDIVQVSAHRFTTVGLKSDGTVVAAGRSDDGQLDVSGWRDIIAVSAGWHHTIGLKSDGTVVFAGNGLSGRGDAIHWRDIAAIASGTFHSVGLKSDGTVVALGRNDEGACDVSSWTGIVAIAAGGYHTVGLKADGTVVAAGDNGDGQLDVSGWRDIIAISAGNKHTVGLKSDGTVVAVGGTSAFRGIEAWSDIVQIATGYFHTVGLKSDGTVVAGGFSNDGQLLVGDWRNIALIAAGGYHTIGIQKN